MTDFQDKIKAFYIVEAFKESGLTHVCWLPDPETGFLYESIEAEPLLTLVPVCREAEAMAVAAGLRIGCKEPAVLIQNTGIYESGDSLRGVVADGAFPLGLEDLGKQQETWQRPSGLRIRQIR